MQPALLGNGRELTHLELEPALEPKWLEPKWLRKTASCLVCWFYMLNKLCVYIYIYIYIYIHIYLSLSLYIYIYIYISANADNRRELEQTDAVHKITIMSFQVSV